MQLDIVTPAGAARICGLSHNAITNNINNGLLEGIWADDGQGGRRLVAITRQELRRYMRERAAAQADGYKRARSSALRYE